jgi:hypothetical protein
MSPHSESCPYGFRIEGPTTGTRRLVGAGRAWQGYCDADAPARPELEGYLSAFTYGEDFRRHLADTGSTKGFDGVCHAGFVWWDVDRKDVAQAQTDTARLAVAICEQLGLEHDDVLAFFSGRRGFHVGVPTSVWSPVPSLRFSKVVRSFAETIATAAGVTIDSGVYDKVRAFRAPNSRHPATGLHKRQVTVGALMELSTDTILNTARTPAPVIWEPTTAASDAAGRLWDQCATEVEGAAQVRTMPRSDGAVPSALNRSTFDFIRNGADAGDRHRLLFSAAANLAEFGCPPDLAFALLTEAGLDSGLPPREVRRQIECGLSRIAPATSSFTVTKRPAGEVTSGH